MDVTAAAWTRITGITTAQPTQRLSGTLRFTKVFTSPACSLLHVLNRPATTTCKRENETILSFATLLCRALLFSFLGLGFLVMMHSGWSTLSESFCVNALFFPCCFHVLILCRPVITGRAFLLLFPPKISPLHNGLKK